MTYRMLKEQYKELGSLPKSRTEAYQYACRQFADELSKSRIEDDATGNFDVSQRLELAHKLATTTLFCQRSQISSNRQYTIKKNVLEMNDPAFHGIPPGLFVETLQTSLFTTKDGTTYSWSHRSYAEFLAGEYVAQSSITIDQLRNLVVSPHYAECGIVPELKETVAWAAAHNSEILQWLFEFEPETILLSDSVVLSSTQKIILFRTLIDQTQKGQFFSHEIGWAGMKRLECQELGEEIRQCLESSAYSDETKRFAIMFARRAHAKSITDKLIEYAVNPATSVELRDETLLTLQYLHSSSSDERFNKLRPLIFDQKYEFVTPQMRSYTLTILWPHHLTATELFQHLHLRRVDEVLVYSHSTFLEKKLFAHLEISDLPIALEWLASSIYRKESELTVSSLNLIGNIMTEAWDNLDDDSVIQALVRVIWSRLDHYLRPLLSSRDRDLEKEISDDTVKRRRLVWAILRHTETVEIPYAHAAVRMIRHDIRFIYKQDLCWLTSTAMLVKSNTIRETLLYLIGSFFPNGYPVTTQALTPMEVKQIETLYPIIESSDLLRMRFADRFVVNLKSQEKNIQRSRKTILDRLTKQEEKKKLTADLRAKIVNKVIESEGNSSNWWKLEWSLRSDDTLLDIRKGSGWASVSDDKKITQRILVTARSYLLEHMNTLNLMTNLIQFGNITPACAGFRALVLLLVHQEQQILDEIDWSNWLGIIIQYPIPKYSISKNSLMKLQNLTKSFSIKLFRALEMNL